jgi:hypothetical protein
VLFAAAAAAGSIVVVVFSFGIAASAGTRIAAKVRIAWCQRWAGLQAHSDVVKEENSSAGWWVSESLLKFKLI